MLKDYRAALADFDKGLQLNANKPEIAYYDRAIANEALGNIRDAYIDYKKAVEIRPDFALATQQLSRFKVVRRKPDGALYFGARSIERGVKMRAALFS